MDECIEKFKSWASRYEIFLKERGTSIFIIDSGEEKEVDSFRLEEICNSSSDKDISLRLAELMRELGVFRQSYTPAICHTPGHLSENSIIVAHPGEIFPICGENNGRHLIVRSSKGKPHVFILFDYANFNDPEHFYLYPSSAPIAGSDCDGFYALFCEPSAAHFLPWETEIKKTFDDVIRYNPKEKQKARLICPMFTSDFEEKYAVLVSADEEKTNLQCAYLFVSTSINVAGCQSKNPHQQL